MEYLHLNRDKPLLAMDEKELANMIKKLEEYGALGAHFFVLNDVELASELLERIR